MLPKALKTCPKSNKLPNLVTLVLQSKMDKSFSDIHIVPQSYSCPFCSLDFDLIGDFDNFRSDVTFVAEKLNILVRSV